MSTPAKVLCGSALGLVVAAETAMLTNHLSASQSIGACAVATAILGGGVVLDIRSRKQQTLSQSEPNIKQ